MLLAVPFPQPEVKLAFDPSPSPAAGCDDHLWPQPDNQWELKRDEQQWIEDSLATVAFPSPISAVPDDDFIELAVWHQERLMRDVYLINPVRELRTFLSTVLLPTVAKPLAQDEQGDDVDDEGLAVRYGGLSPASRDERSAPVATTDLASSTPQQTINCRCLAESCREAVSTYSCISRPPYSKHRPCAAPTRQNTTRVLSPPPTVATTPFSHSHHSHRHDWRRDPERLQEPHRPAKEAPSWHSRRSGGRYPGPSLRIHARARSRVGTPEQRGCNYRPERGVDGGEPLPIAS